MIKYKTSRFSHLITKEEAEKETHNSVWINGRRRSKFSDWDQYHDSFEDAKQYLLKIAEEKVHSAKLALNNAESFLESVKEPKGPNK